jgi:hypothetical protein
MHPYLDDRGKDLDAVLGGILGRRVTIMDELVPALGVPYTTYKSQKDEGRLITAESLIRVARYFGVNEIDLLLRYRVISPEALEEHVQQHVPDMGAIGSAQTKTERPTPRVDLSGPSL